MLTFSAAPERRRRGGGGRTSARARGMAGLALAFQRARISRRSTRRAARRARLAGDADARRRALARVRSQFETRMPPRARHNVATATGQNRRRYRGPRPRRAARAGESRRDRRSCAPGLALGPRDRADPAARARIVWGLARRSSPTRTRRATARAPVRCRTGATRSRQPSGDLGAAAIPPSVNAPRPFALLVVALTHAASGLSSSSRRSLALALLGSETRSSTATRARARCRRVAAPRGANGDTPLAKAAGDYATRTAATLPRRRRARRRRGRRRHAADGGGGGKWRRRRSGGAAPAVTALALVLAPPAVGRSAAAGPCGSTFAAFASAHRRRRDRAAAAAAAARVVGAPRPQDPRSADGEAGLAASTPASRMIGGRAAVRGACTTTAQSRCARGRRPENVLLLWCSSRRSARRWRDGAAPPARPAEPCCRS